jgi:hypothetical protein
VITSLDQPGASLWPIDRVRWFKEYFVSNVLPDSSQVSACGPLRVRCDNARVSHTTAVTDFPSPDPVDSNYVRSTAEYDYDARVESLDLFLQKGSTLKVAK